MSYLSTILVFLNLKVQCHVDDSLEDFCEIYVYLLLECSQVAYGLGGKY